MSAGRARRRSPARPTGAVELVAAALAVAVVLPLAAVRPASLVRTAASGRPLTLAGGPATAVGLLAAGLLSGQRAGGSRAGTVAVLAAAAAGALDDLAEPRPAADAEAATPPPVRGLAGHLGALRRGRVTTGAVKVAVIGAGAVAAAAVLARQRAGVAPGRRPGRRAGRGAGAVPLLRLVGDAGLVAGTANLLNLADLRPGRAGKVAVLATGVLLATGAGPAPGVLGVLASTMPGDLRGRWMLGDTGANALGAALGLQVASAGRRSTRVGWLAVVLALTAASERVSFTAVIADHRLLRVLDDLGRR